MVRVDIEIKGIIVRVAGLFPDPDIRVLPRCRYLTWTEQGSNQSGAASHPHPGDEIRCNAPRVRRTADGVVLVDRRILVPGLPGVAAVPVPPAGHIVRIVRF